MSGKEGVTADEVRYQIVQHTRGRGVELARGHSFPALRFVARAGKS